MSSGCDHHVRGPDLLLVAQHATHDVSGIAVGLLDEMGVHVQGGRSVAVSEATGHGADVHAGGEQLRGDEVSEVAEANVGLPLLRAQPLERARETTARSRQRSC